MTLKLLILLSLSKLCFSSCAHHTFLHPRAAGREGEKKIEIKNFGYGALDGPANWHVISPENMLCSTGNAQSPIDITSSVAIQSPGFVSMEVPVQNVEFENLKTTVEVVIEEGSSVVCGREFKLKQFHFHTPSEHHIGGQHFPVEAHMVHTAKGKQKMLFHFILLSILHLFSKDYQDQDTNQNQYRQPQRNRRHCSNIHPHQRALHCALRHRN